MLPSSRTRDGLVKEFQESVNLKLLQLTTLLSVALLALLVSVTSNRSAEQAVLVGSDLLLQLQLSRRNGWKADSRFVPSATFVTPSRPIEKPSQAEIALNR